MDRCMPKIYSGAVVELGKKERVIAKLNFY